METTSVRLSGRFFKPYSELADGQSLACYYTRITQKKIDSTLERQPYPLSVVLAKNHFSIYWHGHLLDEGRNWEDYGVHLILSFDFSDLHRNHFEEWLEKGVLVPEDMLGKQTALYEPKKIAAEPWRAYTFSDTYFEKYGADDLAQGKSWWQNLYGKIDGFFSGEETREDNPFEGFLLDLLFDLYHSSLFKGHPAYSSLLGFLETMPTIKAIRLKAEHRLALSQLAKAQEKVIPYTTEDKGDKDKAPKDDRVDYCEKADEKAAAKWLKFLLSPEGSATVVNGKEKAWFEGVEAEHNHVYRASKAPHLKEQAEDSVQWLIGRYAFGRAYSLQIGRIFSLYSNVFLFGLALLLFGLYWFGSYFTSLPQPAAFAECHGLFKVMMCISALSVALLAALIVERVLYFSASLLRWLIGKKWPLKSPSRSPGEVMLSFPKIIATLRPKILLASSAVWVFLLSTNFPWNLDFTMSYLKWGIIGALAGMTFLFMAAHFNALVSRKWKVLKVLGRGLLVLIMASIYSFTIGFIGMAAVAEDHFTKEERLSKYFQGFEVADSTLKGDFAKNPKSTYMYTGTTPKDSFKIKDDQWHYENSIHHLYHYYDTTPYNKVFFVHQMKIDSHEQDRAFDMSVRYAIVVESLLFFTFIAVAIGIVLEMGLQIQKLNIGFE